MARIWIDVLTPKQAKLFAHLARRLVNHEILFTARDYDYTIAVLRRFGAEPMVVGGYGHTLEEKLLVEAKRMEKLVDVAKSCDVLLSYPNPVAARVAYGLGVTYVALTDSPHSIHPSKLSLPLARAVVIPSCVPMKMVTRFTLPGTHVEMYRGVDEVEWIRMFRPSGTALKELGLEERRYVVVRPPEVRASYYGSEGARILEEIRSLIEKLGRRELEVVYMPRYVDDVIPKTFARERWFKVVDRVAGIDGTDLVYHALAVITGGGSMAREAALLGTLGITFYPSKLFVDTFVENLGLPHRRVASWVEAVEEIERFAKDPDRHRSEARDIVATLEAPSDAVLRVFEELGIG